MEDVKFNPLSSTAMTYLMRTRKLSAEALEVFRLACSEYNEILIPFYDHYDELRVIKRRAEDGTLLKRRSRDEDGNYEDYECKSDCVKGGKPCLLGANLVTDFSKPLLICYGDYDTMTIYEEDKSVNPVSPSFGDKSLTWIDYHFEWLEKFDKIIIFPDFDQDSKTRAYLFEKIESLARKLGKHKCYIVQEKFLLGCKDPNELFVKRGKQALLDSIAGSLPLSEPGLEFLADHIEGELEEGIPTGFRDLDIATGGLILGGYTVWAGDTGAGKTVGMLNLIANINSAGYNCFYWSGEQQAKKYRWWYEQILAGPNFVDSHVNPRTGRESWFLRNEYVKKVRAWYRPRFIHYDKRGFDHEEFFRVLELSVRRYNIQVAFIDNLMAFTSDDDDEYGSQARFCESLHNFCVDWGIHAVLACHNKKNDPDKPGTLGDVAGTKKITNWADNVLQAYRVPDRLKQETGIFAGIDTIWSLVKNREEGVMEDIRILYNHNSRRLYQYVHPESLERMMGWELAEDLIRIKDREDIEI